MSRIPLEREDASPGVLSREELIELCFTVGLSNLVNRVHATFSRDPDEVTRAAVGDAPFSPVGR